MDIEIVGRINKLTSIYQSNNDPELLLEINNLLKLLEYQSWELKYQLKITEIPEDEFDDEEDFITPSLKEYGKLFGYHNAYSKYHLILPLLLYLLPNHMEKNSALTTAIDFMKESQDYLHEGDFAKTKTGVQRFITNSRFAALELRKFGLLRSDQKYYFKNWKLSLFGVLIAGAIYYDYKKDLSNSYFNKEYSSDKARLSAMNTLRFYMENLLKYDKMKKIINDLFEDEEISEYFGLWEKSFLEFVKLLTLVIEQGYNSKKDSTKKFISLLNNINANKEIARLTDSMIMKKDIDVNMKDIYNIIGRRKNYK